MYKNTTPETPRDLVDQMRGLIMGASHRNQEGFNTASQEIWSNLTGFICDGTVSIGATFNRSRRESDHYTLPSQQENTTIFKTHADPKKLIEVRAGEVLRIVEPPELVEEGFVFSLIIPVLPDATVVRWSLLHTKPTIVHNIMAPAELQ